MQAELEMIRRAKAERHRQEEKAKEEQMLRVFNDNQANRSPEKI